MNLLNKCKCRKLPNYLIANNMQKPFNSMENVETKSNDWVHLKKCPYCNQYWQVDEHEKYQNGLAIKVNSPEYWHNSSDFEIRKNAMIKNHGGLSDNTCKWESCNQLAMCDMAFCAKCAYTQQKFRE